MKRTTKISAENISKVLATAAIPFALFMFIYCTSKEAERENMKHKQAEASADIKQALNNTNVFNY